MPFNLENFDLMTGSRNLRSISAFQYSGEENDTEANIKASGYFNSIRTRLNLGDMISAYSPIDNKTILLQVESLEPAVEVRDISHSSGDGDMMGPASALNNEVLISSGTTGKILKRSNGFLIDPNTPTWFNGNIPFFNTDSSGLTVDNVGNFNYDPATKSFQVGGGNNPSGINAVCLGGFSNNAQASFSATVGGAAHLIANDAMRSVALGGLQANIEAINCASLGGNNNQILANSDGSLIGGGGNNTISGSTISCIWSSASSSITNAQSANIIGGTFQVISAGADFAGIFGGDGNFIGANATYSIILGGQANAVRSPWACAGGDGVDVSTTADNSFGYGEATEIKSTHSVSFGRNNTHATGANYSSTIGQLCDVTAEYAHAKGLSAKAIHQGSHVYSDSQIGNFESTATNQFSTRFLGGHRFIGGGPMLMSIKTEMADGDIASYQLNPYIEEFELGFHFKWKDSFGDVHKQIVAPEAPIIIPNTVADYTVIERDKGRTHVITQAGVNTFRFPADMSPGARVKVVIAGGGTTTFATSGGSTLHSVGGLLVAAVDGTIDAVKTDATNWYLTGDLT